MIPGIVYWYGGRAVVDGDISIGTLVAFALLTQRVFGPFASIARINVTMLSSLALFERIFEYLDEDVEIEERAEAVALHPHGARSHSKRSTSPTTRGPVRRSQTCHSRRSRGR